MDIINVKVGDLIPYENNPRKNDEAVDKVALSISAFGFKVPIVIDRNNVVVTGHTRLKAAQKLGLTEVPCIRADDLTDEQIKAFRLADNKVAEFSSWDEEKLMQELEELGDIDMSLYGFDELAAEADEITAESQEGNLAKRYLVPPFSVIYGNRGDWLSRKRAWTGKGIRSELGRGGGLAYNSRSNPEANFLHRGGGTREARHSKTTND